MCRPARHHAAHPAGAACSRGRLWPLLPTRSCCACCGRELGRLRTLVLLPRLRCRRRLPKLPAVNRLPSAVYRLPSSVYRLPSSVYRLPSAVYCLPSTVCRLPSTRTPLPSPHPPQPPRLLALPPKAGLWPSCCAAERLEQHSPPPPPPPHLPRPLPWTAPPPRPLSARFAMTPPSGPAPLAPPTLDTSSRWVSMTSSALDSPASFLKWCARSNEKS
jgi:hypothetical protein